MYASVPPSMGNGNQCTTMNPRTPAPGRTTKREDAETKLCRRDRPRRPRASVFQTALSSCLRKTRRRPIPVGLARRSNAAVRPDRRPDLDGISKAAN